MKPHLPAKRQLAYASKRGLILVITALLILAGFFLCVFGQWKAAHRLILKMVMRRREVEIAQLDETMRVNKDKLTLSEAMTRELEAKRKALEQQRTIAEMEMKGKTHAEVVAELRARGL